MARKRSIGFGMLAAVFAAVMYFGIVVPAFSDSLPPPTGLTAETQAVNSGQIKLQWKKPVSDEVIGYRVYRDSVYIDYLIGADSRTYYDNNLSPSISYSYFVKAVYLGVVEKDLPSSNTISAVSPAYCSGGAAECVGLNPFVAGPGRTIVDLGGAKLWYTGPQYTSILPVSLPAGRYQVQVRSFDAYTTRAVTNPQFHEQFFVSLLSGATELTRSGLTPDLVDWVAETGETAVVSNELVLNQSVSDIRGVHISVTGDGTENANSVGASAAMFVDMDATDPGCLLDINKFADKQTVALGEGILYTITVTNKGTANCTGVAIYDYLPWEVEYIGEIHNDSISRVSESEGPYYPGEHMVLLAATTPFTPGEVGVIDLLVKVKTNLPNGSCREVYEPSGDGTITDRAYAVGNEYGGGSVRVYSNSVTTKCDSQVKPAQIDTTVVPSPNPSYPGGTVTWTAQPFGSCLGPFEYVWDGDDGLTGNSASVSHVYNRVGLYYASVKVSAPSCEPVTKRSPVQISPPSATLSVNCSVDPLSATVFVGEQVTVTAVPQGGTPPYVSYRWVGDVDTRNPTDQKSHRAVYATAGTKKLNVRVTDSSGQFERCDRDAEITVKARKPSFEEI